MAQIFMEVKANKMSAVTFVKMNVDVRNENNCHNYDDDEYLRSNCIALCVLKKFKNNLFNSYIKTSEFLFNQEFSQLLKKIQSNR